MTAPVSYRNPELPPPADPSQPYGPPFAATASVEGDFWEGWVQDPRLYEIVAASAYCVADLPKTGLEFLHVLDQVSHRVRQREDLELQLSGDVRQGVVLDHRDGLTGVGGGRRDGLDGSANRCGSAEVAHESSPSVGRRAGQTAGVAGAPGASTPGAVDPTVGDTADTTGVPSARAVSAACGVGVGAPVASSPTLVRRWTPEAIAVGDAVVQLIEILGLDLAPYDVEHIEIGPGRIDGALVTVRFATDGCGPQVRSWEVPL